MENYSAAPSSMVTYSLRWILCIMCTGIDSGCDSLSPSLLTYHNILSSCISSPGQKKNCDKPCHLAQATSLAKSHSSASVDALTLPHFSRTCTWKIRQNRPRMPVAQTPVRMSDEGSWFALM